jgi:PAS domain S-box-containing protein
MSAKGLDRSLPMAAIACGASLMATWIVVTAYDLGTTALHAGPLVVLLAVNMALALLTLFLGRRIGSQAVPSGPMADSVPAMAWTLTPSGELKEVNLPFEAYTGKTAAEVRADPTAVLHPEDAPSWTEQWQRARRSGEEFEGEYRYRQSDGTYRWFETRSRPIRETGGSLQHWVCIAWDIDGRKQSEMAARQREAHLREILDNLNSLRDSENTLRTTIDAVPALVWRTDADGNVDYLNKRCVEYHGQSTDEHRVNMGWSALLHPDEKESVVQRWLAAVATHSPFDHTYRFRRKDGVYRWMRVCVEPLFADDGRVLSWYGTHTDVHEQKLAEEALQESERRLSLILETIPAMVWRADAVGDIDYINQRCVDNLGLTLEDFQSFGWLTLVHPEDVDPTLQRWHRARQERRPYEAIYRFRYRDGIYRWFKAAAAPLYDRETGDVTSWYGLHVDIDDSKKLEGALRATQAELARASQVATVGELSASIAHEINQPLAAVVFNGAACLRWLAAAPPNLERARQTVEKIVRDGTSAAAIVTRIRSLFRHAPPDRMAADVNEIIGEVLQLMQDERDHRRITVVTELSEDLPRVMVDKVQVQQVLTNLVQNGMDAMDPVVGRVKSLVIRSFVQNTDMVTIEIRDRGTGIVDMEMIFEPFFTTKSKGLGVGLSICRSIVESHGGRIWAMAGDSGDGGDGATLAFTLPIACEVCAPPRSGGPI